MGIVDVFMDETTNKFVSSHQKSTNCNTGSMISSCREAFQIDGHLVKNMRMRFIWDILKRVDIYIILHVFAQRFRSCSNMGHSIVGRVRRDWELGWEQLSRSVVFVDRAKPTWYLTWKPLLGEGKDFVRKTFGRDGVYWLGNRPPM